MKSAKWPMLSKHKGITQYFLIDQMTMLVSQRQYLEFAEGQVANIRANHEVDAG